MTAPRPLPSNVPSIAESLEARRLLAFSPIQYSTKGYESGYETTIDAQGNTITAGLFQHTIDFDPGAGVTKLTAVGETDIFIAKYSPSGALIWAGHIGGEKSDSDDPLPIDPSLAGSFVNRVGIQPDFLGEYVNGIVTDASGNVFLTGTFYHTADFDPGPGTFNLTANPKYGLYDAFLVKLTSAGKLDWADAFGGQFNDVSNAVAIDAAGNPVVTGYFTRAADFDPGPGVFTETDSDGRDEIFVAKYGTASGKLVWVDAIGGDALKEQDRDAGNGLAIDSLGNIYVTGTFAGSKVDFDPSPHREVFLKAAKETDAFLLKLSPKGKYVFAENFGGKGLDGGVKVALRGDGVYTASYFQGTADVDPGPATQLITSIDDDRHTDVLISRFDTTSGALQWASRIGGDGYETIGGFGIGADGSIYTSGGFAGTADFNPSSAEFNLTSVLGDDNFKDDNDSGRDFSYDVYVSRLSPRGKFLGAIQIGSSGDDFGTGLALNTDGSLVLTGQFRNTVLFDTVTGKKKLKAQAQDGFLIELPGEL